MTDMNPKARSGSNFDDLFEELGELEKVRALTRKKVIAYELRQAMKTKKVTPAEMARRMKTSRPVVYRLLDPSAPSATLDTLGRASTALDLELEVRFVPRVERKGRSRTNRAA